MHAVNGSLLYQVFHGEALGFIPLQNNNERKIRSIDVKNIYDLILLVAQSR